MSSSISWRPRHSVKTRLILIQIILSAFLVSLLAAFLYFPAKNSIETSADNGYFILTNNLVAMVFNSLAAGDNEGIIAAAKRVEGVKGVSYVLVQDKTDKVIYDSWYELNGQVLADNVSQKIREIKNIDRLDSARHNEKFFEYAAPFLVNNQTEAIVRIAVAQKNIQGEFERLRDIYIKIAAFVVFLAIIISYLIAIKLTKPIRKLTENALAIRAGNLDTVADIHSDDEMEQLAREFGRMVDQLKVFYLKEVHEKEKAIEERHKIEIINEQLRELDRKKNEFLSIASHQLRTPLTVIRWTISTLLEKDLANQLGEEKMKMLKETEKSARTMESLIGELLDLSRIQRGKSKFSFKDIDTLNYIKEIFDGFETLAKEKEINLKFEKGTKPIPMITSDEHAIRHIVANLIDNAIRYTPNKGKVTVRLDSEDSAVVFRVSDTGIGISDDERGRIFKQFSRGERAMRVSPDGSGLGLYLVKSLVEELGGAIDLKSEVGQGSTFSITLPLRQPIGKQESTAADSTKNSNIT